MGSGMLNSTITAHALQNLIQRLDDFRLPFGLCTAPENLNGVCTIHDDILVFGEGSKEDET